MRVPCIITVAITGSLPTKADNPAVPITIAEQIESTQEAKEASRRLRSAEISIFRKSSAKSKLGPFCAARRIRGWPYGPPAEACPKLPRPS